MFELHRNGVALGVTKLMNRRTFIASSCWTCAAAGIGMLSGCRENTDPSAVALIIDPTDSAMNGRKKARAAFRQLIAQRFIPYGSSLAIIRADDKPEIVWSGKVTDLKDILAEYDAAWSGAHCGSDPAAALGLACSWLAAPMQKSAGRKLLTGWLDCLSDACKNQKPTRSFSSPSDLPWTGGWEIEICIFGVPVSLHERLKAAWSDKLRVPPRFFDPSHQFSAKDIGLTHPSLW